MTRARAGVIAQIVAVAAALVLLAHCPPRPNPYFACPLHALTGLWCPGCGATRSLWLLLHGDLAGAFAYHPFFPLAVPVAVGLWARVLRRSWRGEPAPPYRPWDRRWVRAVSAAILVFWLLRNLPGEPFRHLAPPPEDVVDRLARQAVAPR